MNRTDIILSRFPQFYQSQDTQNLLYSFINAFAEQLDEAEDALVGVMNAHWVKTANNEPPPTHQKERKGDIDKILTLYLESLGGTALTKQLTRTSEADDDLYRQRIMSLIHVLKSGPITKQGIQDIIAANIGIANDMDYADEAKKQIRIVDFLLDMVEAPNQKNKKEQKISLFEAFTIKNEGSDATIPVFRLEFNTVTSEGRVITPPLMNVKIRNTTKPLEVVESIGEVQVGDILVFLSEGAFLNGQKHPPTKQVDLPRGDSTFQIEARWGTSEEHHPIARFDNEIPIHNAVFTNREPFVHLETSYQKRTYAAFRAVVPWDIAGFSSTIAITQNTLDKLRIFNVSEPELNRFKTLIGTYETLKSFYDAFDKVESLFGDALHRDYLKQLLLREADLKDKYARFTPNPRHQIAAIVERVKAAGVYSEVAFEKRFGEHQQLEDRLKFIITQIQKEDHEIKEKGFSVNIVVQIKEALESADSFKFAAVLAETLELADALTLAPVLVEKLELKDSLTFAPVLVETLELKDSLKFAGNGEKRFAEEQPLEDRLNIAQTKTQMESQEMEDSRFRADNKGQLVEKLELADTLRLSAVFDFTYFDSLNGFAESAVIDFTSFDSLNFE